MGFCKRLSKFSKKDQIWLAVAIAAATLGISLLVDDTAVQTGLWGAMIAVYVAMGGLNVKKGCGACK